MKGAIIQTNTHVVARNRAAVDVNGASATSRAGAVDGLDTSYAPGPGATVQKQINKDHNVICSA